MSKIRRVDFSPDEWLAGTRELTLEERGAYWDVCSLMYSRGGPIADDDRWVAKALSVNPRTWRALKARLIEKGKLRVEADHILNSRSIREIESAEKRLNGARIAAELSSKSRRKRVENARESLDFNEIPEAGATFHSQAITNHQPSTTNHQRKNEREPAPPASLAVPLPDGWEPSTELLERVAKTRPDIQPARLKLELEGFKSHAIANRRLAHNWEEAFAGWIIKTRIEEARNGTQRSTGQSRRGGSTAAAIVSYLEKNPPRPDGPHDGTTEPEIVGSASLADTE